MKKLKMVSRGSITLEEDFNLYPNHCRARNPREATIRPYRQSYDRFYKYFDRYILDVI